MLIYAADSPWPSTTHFSVDVSSHARLDGLRGTSWHIPCETAAHCDEVAPGVVGCRGEVVGSNAKLQVGGRVRDGGQRSRLQLTREGQWVHSLGTSEGIGAIYNGIVEWEAGERWRRLMATGADVGGTLGVPAGD
jgi:hypothetical protein